MINDEEALARLQDAQATRWATCSTWFRWIVRLLFVCSIGAASTLAFLQQKMDGPQNGTVVVALGVTTGLLAAIQAYMNMEGKVQQLRLKSYLHLCSALGQTALPPPPPRPAPPAVGTNTHEEQPRRDAPVPLQTVGAPFVVVVNEEHHRHNAPAPLPMSAAPSDALRLFHRQQKQLLGK